MTDITTKEIRTWLVDEYNDGLSFYEYKFFVRLTNGSAAFFLDIRHAEDDTFSIRGERYGETIQKTCEANRERLLATLSQTI